MKTNIHFWSYLAQFFLEWEMFQTKVVQEIKTHILCSLIFFPENRAVYEIMWKNNVERGRPQMAIWRRRIAYWIPTATHTQSEYVILIDFPQQQWLQERNSMLHLYDTASLLLLITQTFRHSAHTWPYLYPISQNQIYAYFVITDHHTFHSS